MASTPTLKVSKNYQGAICKECGGPIKDHRRKNFCSDECKKLRQRKQTAEAVKRYQAKKRAERIKKGLTVRRTRRASTIKPGKQAWCEYYQQLISPEECKARQGRIGNSASGMFIDGHCRETCKGTALQPATEKQIDDHRKMVRRIAEERGYEVIVR